MSGRCARDSKRDLGAELLASVREMKVGAEAHVHRVPMMLGGIHLTWMIGQLAASRAHRVGHLSLGGWPVPCPRKYAKTHAWNVPGSAEYWRIFERIEMGLQP
jgi:hypothetical protein